MYKKAWCTCKLVVLLNKPIAVLTFSLPSPSLLLKLPINNSCPGGAREAGRGVGASSPGAVTATDYTQIAECQSRNLCICLGCLEETTGRLTAGFLPRYVYKCRIRQAWSSQICHWVSCHDKNVQPRTLHVQGHKLHLEQRTFIPRSYYQTR